MDCILMYFRINNKKRDKNSIMSLTKQIDLILRMFRSCCFPVETTTKQDNNISYPHHCLVSVSVLISAVVVSQTKLSLFGSQTSVSSSA